MAVVMFSVFTWSSAAGLESIDLHNGLVWIGNPPYVPASIEGAPTGAPSPILNTIAVSFPILISGPLYFVPELGLFGTQYGLVAGFDKTVPVEREYADAIWFLGALVELGLWLDFNLSSAISLGLELGASFLGRIPMFPWGDGWEQLDSMAAYLYGAGRFVYPSAGILFSWGPETTDGIEIALRTKAYVPIFHFWDGEGSDFIDQFMIKISVGVRFLTTPRSEGETET